MSPIARLPVFLALAGKRAMLAGGSSAAAWKADLLSAAGAQVDVYAEEISAELRALADAPPRGSIMLHRRAWTAGDLETAAVAVGAFADDADAAHFAQAARKAGVPVNVIDKPAFCDFAFGAIVNRSPLVIGISTDGAAPVFAHPRKAGGAAAHGLCSLGRGGAALAFGRQGVGADVPRALRLLAAVRQARRHTRRERADWG